MLSETHWHLSETIISSMDDDKKSILEERAFRWGCCLPDYFWGHPHHTIEKSFSYLTQLLNELQVRPAPYRPGDKRGFSFRVGIAVHYICDYFCRAHNERYYENLLQHVLYESRLQNEFSRLNLLQLTQAAADRSKSGDLLQKPLPQLIRDKHNAYLAEAPAMRKDIFYAVDTAASVLSVLLNLPMPAINQAA